MADNQGEQVPQNNAQGQVPVIFLFALSPAQAVRGPIDYQSKLGGQIYKEGIERLSCNKFDCQASNLKVFLQCLKDKACRCGWQDILNIPRDLAQPNDDLLDLIDHYGEIELTHLKRHVTTYLTGQTRAAQEESLLYSCLTASLNQDALTKVSTWESDYKIGGLPSGTLYLKVILRETHIDTRGTVLNIRDQLSKLDSYIPTINHDITKFNEHVMDLHKGLLARGKKTEDLLSNIFKAYRVVADADFRDWVKQKKNAYDEGEDLTPESLMHLAAMKYTNMVRDGEWNAPSAAEEKILALEAKLVKLQKQTKKEEKATPRRSPQKDKKGKPKPDWMLKQPKAADINKSKKMNNKEYWWCPNHKSFTRHKPSECHGINTSPRATNGNPATSENGTPPSQTAQQAQLRLSNALSSIAEEE